MSAFDAFSLLHDPDFVEWAERTRAHLVPLVADADATVSLVPQGPADIKFAVELGLSIMLNKPIIAVVRPGQEVPPRLRLVCDAVVMWEVGMSPDALREALDRALS